MYAVKTPLRRLGAALMLSAALSGMMGALPATPAAAAAGQMVVQNTGGGNVRYRAGAGTGYDVRGTLSEGDKVYVLEGPVKAGTSSWYRISIGKQIGWV